MFAKRVHRLALMLGQDEIYYLWVDRQGEVVKEASLPLDQTRALFPKQWRRPEASLSLGRDQLHYCEKIVSNACSKQELEAEVTIEFSGSPYGDYLKTPLDSAHDFLQIYALQPAWIEKVETLIEHSGLNLVQMLPEWQSLLQFLRGAGVKEESFSLHDAEQNYQVSCGKIQPKNLGCQASAEPHYDLAEYHPELSLRQKILRGSLLYD